MFSLITRYKLEYLKQPDASDNLRCALSFQRNLRVKCRSHIQSNVATYTHIHTDTKYSHTNKYRTGWQRHTVLRYTEWMYKANIRHNYTIEHDIYLKAIES